jgi:hypothetical protein
MRPDAIDAIDPIDAIEPADATDARGTRSAAQCGSRPTTARRPDDVRLHRT